jgi:hypothetical protein
MFHVCVQRFNITDTAQKFLGLFGHLNQAWTKTTALVLLMAWRRPYASIGKLMINACQISLSLTDKWLALAASGSVECVAAGANGAACFVRRRNEVPLAGFIHGDGMWPLTDSAQAWLSLWRQPASQAWALFSSRKFCKIFQDFLSHRIFRHMYEALNIDKKIKLITQFSRNSRYKSFKPN